MFGNRLFLRIVVGPSAIWMLLCMMYVSNSIGWGLIFYLLPHEVAIMVTTFVLPVFLLVLWFFLATGQAHEAWSSDEIERQGELLDEVQQTLESLSQSLAGSAKFTSGDMQVLRNIPNDIANLKVSNASSIDGIVKRIEQITDKIGDGKLAGSADIKAISDNVAGLLETQGKETRDITIAVDQLLRNQNERKGLIDFSEIRQQTALLGLINFALNDMNVCATRLLVRLMEHEERQRDEIRDFIQGLVNAYSVGDRSVFFSVLHHQLAKNKERVVSLQTLAENAPEIAADLSKIIRGIKEITSMIEQFTRDNIATVLFDDTILRSLAGVLEPHFTLDGNPVRISVS
jgi:hypothetical protein